MGPKGVGNPFLLVHTLRHLHPVSSRLGPKTSHAGLITACTACVSCLRKYPAASTGGAGEGRWGRWGKWEAKGVKGGEERGGKGEGCWMLACSYTAWPASQSRCSDNQNEHNPTMKWLVHDESTRQSRGGGLKGRGSSPSVLFPSLNHSCFAGSPSLKLRCFSFDLLHAVQKTV